MSLGFKVSETQKNTVNRIINKVMKEKKINKSDAFVFIIEKYEDNLIDNIKGDYIPANVRDVLIQINDKCSYIGFINDQFICRENMLKKKKPDILEGEPEAILKNCLACIQRKIEIEQNKRNTEMRKESIKKLRTFMTNFIAVSKSGFKYTAFMCLRNAEEGKIIFSRGGESIQCPLIENELVNIQHTCMEKINPDTGNKPCEYLASLEGIQSLDPSIFKDISDVLSEESFIPYRENELEEVKKQNERLGVNAEFEIIEDEEKEDDNNE